MKPYSEIEVLTAKKWTRTHTKFKHAYGASFCRLVDENDADKKELLSPKNIPTCQECLLLLMTQVAMERRDPIMGIAISRMHKETHK
jgi:hypothetical protein